MILNTFDHAFLINLDHEPEKFARSDDRLKQMSIQAERLPAVVPKDKGSFRSIAALGCIESHIQAVRLAKQRAYKSVLVFEDDVFFRTNFLVQWAKIERSLASREYDLFYFYNWHSAAWNPWHVELVRIENTACTHAYAVHSRFYDEALRLYAENSIAGLEADQLFNSSHARIYAPTYNLIGQDAGYSTLRDQQKMRRWSAHTDRRAPPARPALVLSEGARS